MSVWLKLHWIPHLGLYSLVGCRILGRPGLELAGSIELLDSSNSKKIQRSMVQ